MLRFQTGLALLAGVAVSVLAIDPAQAGTFSADFAGTTLGPKLTAVTSGNMKVSPTVSVGGGSVVIGYASTSTSYDFGVERLVTTFAVTGDFLAHVTLQTRGTVEAGLEMFSGAAPAQLNPNGSSTSFSNELNGYGNSGQTIGYQRPSGYGYSLQAYSTLDLELRRTGSLIERLYDRHDGRGYIVDPNANSTATSLGGPVFLALFLTNVSGNATATFTDFTISGNAIADSAPKPIPEPASLALLLLGTSMLASLQMRRRRR